MNQEMQEHEHQGMKMSYRTFAGMILTSMVVMYGLMYLNTYEFAHVRWSETRLYMTFIMGAAMAVIMLSFMRGMYSNKNSISPYILAVWWCFFWRFFSFAVRPSSATHPT